MLCASTKLKKNLMPRLGELTVSVEEEAKVLVGVGRGVEAVRPGDQPRSITSTLLSFLHKVSYELIYR